MLKILHGNDCSQYDYYHDNIYKIYPLLDEYIEHKQLFNFILMPNINNLNMIWKDFRVAHLTNVIHHALECLSQGSDMVITGITDPFMIDIILEIGFVRYDQIYCYKKPIIEDFKTIGVQNNEDAEIADIQQYMSNMTLYDKTPTNTIHEYGDTEMCDNYLDTLDIDDPYAVEDMYRGYDD